MELSAAGVITPPLLSSPAVTPTGDAAVQPDKSISSTSRPADLESVSRPGTDATSGGQTGVAEKDENKSTQGSATQLTEEQLKVVQQLETRDREVRQHEQAHASVGGVHTGAPELEYTRGPDGRMYATSGEVSVDTSAVSNDPQATIEKMRTVISAALAPAEPSTQDRQVAAKAQALLTEALASLSLEDAEQEGEADKNESVEAEGNAASGMSPDQSRQDDSDHQHTMAETPLHQPEEKGVHTLDDIRLEMERRLVDTGVFTKVFPEGSVIEQQV